MCRACDDLAGDAVPDPTLGPTGRRRFIATAAGTAAAGLLLTGLASPAGAETGSRPPGPPPVPQRDEGPTGPGDRVLDLYRIHARERLRIAYVRGGEYVESALAKVDRICRDNLRNETTRMDVTLIDHVWAVKDAIGADAVVEIVSAYRTPKTNEFLRGKSKNVAKKSLHMRGRAIDIRIRGLDATALADVAEALKLGGVGFYERSGFVHLDTGRPRRWNIY